MISRVSHATIWVQDQEEARKFYTDVLGFETRFDVKMENGFRWLTVGLKAQPDFQVILMEPKAGGILHTQNCRATYEELKRRGVEFIEPPEDKFYGVEALLRDNSGNWFSMTEPKAMYEKP
jgi:catechol 2,3-dioxygenase-like lactoylglutathione lyase family enzyme